MWHHTYRVCSVYAPNLLEKNILENRKPTCNVYFLDQLVSPPYALCTSECFCRRAVLFSQKVLLRTGSDRQSLASSEPLSAAGTHSISHLSHASRLGAESSFSSMGKRATAQSWALLTGHFNITSPSLLIHGFSFNGNRFQLLFNK